LNDDGTESLSVMLSNMHRSFERAQVYEPACRQRIICEIGAGHKMPATFPEKSFGHSVDSFFGYLYDYLSSVYIYNDCDS
jgi:hypothetical protein